MPYGTFSTPVNAPVDFIWSRFDEKARTPHRFIPYKVEDFKVHEVYPDGILREIKTAEMHMKERVKFDKEHGTVTFTLVDHPLYEGYLMNQVAAGNSDSGGLPVITYTMDVKPRSAEAEKHPDAAWFNTASQPEAVKKAVMHMKQILESEAPKTDSNASATGQKTQLQKVGEMVEVLMAKKWDKFMPYFHKDLFYKVGAAEPLHGITACRDLLAHIYTKLEFTSHDVRAMWDIGNVVIIEMDANYNVIGENRTVTVPCCDIYRFDADGLINEWRVYPDASRINVQF